MDFTPAFDQTFFLLAFLHCLIGAIATTISVRKGYNFWRWLLIGLIGGTFGLMWSIYLPKNED